MTLCIKKSCYRTFKRPISVLLLTMFRVNVAVYPDNHCLKVIELLVLLIVQFL